MTSQVEFAYNEVAYNGSPDLLLVQLYVNTLTNISRKETPMEDTFFGKNHP